jgi:hypothetical protein
MDWGDGNGGIKYAGNEGEIECNVNGKEKPEEMKGKDAFNDDGFSARGEE